MLQVSRSAALFLGLFVLSGLPASADGPLTLLSKADPAQPSGTAGGAGRVAGVSSDGRYVLFLSSATNLLSGVSDVNGGDDLFFHDRVAGTTTLISHTALDPATTANHITLDASLSADGRYVAFRSVATDLVSGQDDSAVTADVFLWNRELGTTILISHESGFPLVTTGLCWGVPHLSADGGQLVFVSTAPNLIPGQTDNDFTDDAFLYDRAGSSTSLVSHTSSSSTTAAGGVSQAVISADGNWIAFNSNADNLVTGQTPSLASDVFLFSRATSTNILASHTSASTTATANGYSGEPVISADGGRIAYFSGATNLVAGQVDSNGELDVFLYDRATNGNVLVSRTSGSATTAGNSFSEEYSLSADGRYVAFSSYSSNLVAGDFNSRLDVFLYDRNVGTNVLVSRSSSSPGTPSNGWSETPQVATDGSFVVFRGDGSNLVAGQVDTTAPSDDLFLWTRSSGTTALVSHEAGLPATSGKGPSGSSFRISADGAWIALASLSETLDLSVDDLNSADDVFLHQRSTGQNNLITARGGAVSALAGGSIAYTTRTAMSNDGRYIAFTSNAPNVVPGVTDGNNASDVFLYDRLTGATTLVSHANASPIMTADAGSRQPLVSTDGSVVLFESDASNLAPGQTTGVTRQLYLWDRTLGQITLVSRSAASPSVPGNGGIWGQGYYSVSGDGRWIVFNDYASNLIAGQSDSNGGGDIFLYDRAAGTTTLISHSSASSTQTANGISGALAISADGRYIAFQSDAGNLVSGQPSAGGIFVYDRIAGTTLRASASGDGYYLAISVEGQRVVFTSSASNVVPGQVDSNFNQDVFVWDRGTATIRLVSHVPGSPTTTGNGLSSFGTISPGPPVMSADGRWITFYSNATNLVTGQTEGNTSGDIFLFDNTSGTVTLVSRSTASPTTTGNKSSAEPALSADGRFVAFLSQADNLVPGQINQNTGYDFFLYNREAGTTALVSHIPSSEVTSGNLAAAFFQDMPRISADGAWVAFDTASPDLVSDDHDGVEDAFLYANPLPGRDFFTVSPCRVLDTRVQAPVLTSGIERTVTIAGACGIPATARAVAANVTVIQPTGQGHLTLHPGDLAAPLTSTINFNAGITRANNALLSLALDGTGTLSLTPSVAGGGTVHVTVDLSGYFDEGLL